MTDACTLAGEWMMTSLRARHHPQQGRTGVRFVLPKASPTRHDGPDTHSNPALARQRRAWDQQIQEVRPSDPGGDQAHEADGANGLSGLMTTTKLGKRGLTGTLLRTLLGAIAREWSSINANKCVFRPPVFVSCGDHRSTTRCRGRPRIGRTRPSRLHRCRSAQR
jgi:hypothetical protein